MKYLVMLSLLLTACTTQKQIKLHKPPRLLYVEESLGVKTEHWIRDNGDELMHTITPSGKHIWVEKNKTTY